MDLVKFREIVNQKKVCIISDFDLDGSAGAALFHFFMPSYSDTYKVYQTKINDVDLLKDIFTQNEVVIFADLAPTEETYQWLINNGKEVIIFDHHVSTRERLGDLPNYIYDVNKSATKIVYDFFTDGLKRFQYKNLTEFVSYVNAYDLFLTDTEDFKTGFYLNAVLMHMVMPMRRKEMEEVGYKRFIDHQLRKIRERPERFYLSNFEKDIGKEEDERIKKEYKNARKNMKVRTDSEGRKYLYFELSAKISVVANKLIEEIDYIDYIVVFNKYVPKDLKFSLRARKDGFDVRKIAEKYGGGGHQSAAGIQLDDEQLCDAIRIGRKHFG